MTDAHREIDALAQVDDANGKDSLTNDLLCRSGEDR
jgi:hypothetical protein